MTSATTQAARRLKSDESGWTLIELLVTATLLVVVLGAVLRIADGTQEIAEKTMIEDFQPLLIPRRRDLFSKIVTPYHGLPGKGSAFRTVFEIARQLQVKASAVVDADIRSATPEWIDSLIRPVLDGGFDFVNPYYLRHKFDATITNSIVYPLTRTLYGKQIRQPIGGDF